MTRRSSRSAASVLGAVAGIAVIVVALCWPILSSVPDGDSVGPDPVVIDDYRTDLRVDGAGELAVTETLTTSFPLGRHGIFRFFDVVDPDDPRARLTPHDIDVTLDGGEVPVDYSWESGRRYRVAKIGDPDRTLPAGRHVFTITYRIDGVLTPDQSAGSRFDWQVVPGGWRMSIRRTEARVSLPAPARTTSCGVDGSTTGCAVDGTGSTVLTVRTGPLPPGTAVALRTEADTPPPGRDLVPWPVAWDGVLGSSLPTAAGIAVLGPLAFLIGRRWSTSARENPPEPALTVTPPEGLGPVQTAFVVDEAVPPHGLVATLLHQAERELVRLREQDDGTWSVEGLGGDWTAVDPVTAAVGTRLGVAREGGSFEADGSIEAGRALASARDAIGPATRAWALEAGVLVRARAETRARLAVAAAAVAFLGLAVTAPGGMTLWALPFGTLALGGAGLVRGGVGLRRTERGRALWSQAEGLRRMMCAPPGGDQLDLSAGRDLYPASIPYAVAFGCAEGWAQKYRMSTGEPPPEPRWVPVPRLAAVPGPAVALASVQSFEASLTATIGSYQASQISSTGAGSSSSGSGGGGSGGGGGGGSW